MHFDGDKTSTRFMEQNICNLAYAQFDSSNKWGIPDMLPVHIDNLENVPLQGFNFALKEKHPERIGCHFFLHDYQFERVWNYPDRYIPVLQKFQFVLSPDFSPYADMPEALKVYNVYRNRWCGRYWQDFDIKVIPTITWGGDSSLEYCLQGVPKHSTIAISTMNEGRWAKWQSLRRNWNRIVDTLEPETILLYGKNIIDEFQLKGNIVFKRLISSKVVI